MGAGAVFGYTGFTRSAGILLECRPGGSMRMPRNLDIPYPISNQPFGYVNYAEGLRYPSVSLPIIPMASWFNATNFNNWFLGRSAAPLNDTPEIAGGIDFADSTLADGAYHILHAKGGAFTLNFAKGQPVGFMGQFVGTDRQMSGLTAPASGVNGTPLDFSLFNPGGPLANIGIVGATLEYSNNLTPNMELDGTQRPTELNADLPTSTLTIVQNANPNFAAPGFYRGDTPIPLPYPEVTGATLNCATVPNPGAGQTAQFAIGRCVIRNPDDREQQRGRVMRRFIYDVFGTLNGYPVACNMV